jgi:Fe-S-cluster-containing hydrogenase component 2
MATLKTNEPMEGAWIEAFKVGTWTDSAGYTSPWPPDRIDALLAKYNPSFHTAPIRIDHIEPLQRKGRGPAFGWIAAARRDGDRVMVKLSQVQPQFEEWVRSGMLKARSIAWDQDKGIHHLAFLGYNCPAIPGMENVYDDGDNVVTIQFKEGGSMTKENEKNPLKRAFAAFMQFMSGGAKERSQFCADCKDNVCVSCCPTGAVSMTADKGAIIDPAKCTVCYACSRACCMMRDPVQGMEVANYNDKETEMKIEEVEAVVAKAVGAAIKQFSDQLAVFSEENKGLKTELTGLRKQFSDSAADGDRREFTAFCASLPTRIAPAQIPALVAHMQTLKGAEPVEFDDGKGNKITKSQLEMYQESLKALPQTIQLSEFATGDRVGNRKTVTVDTGEFGDGQVDEDRLQLHSDVLAYQEAHAGTSYDTALTAVMSKKGGN